MSSLPPPEIDPHEHDLPSEDEARVGGFVPPPPEACTWAMACHLAAFAGPWGPLVPWLMKRDLHPFVDDAGKEALNFQIAATVAAVVLLVIGFATCGLGLVIAVPGIIAISVAVVIYVILGAMATSRGEVYRYPFTWRFIR